MGLLLHYELNVFKDTWGQTAGRQGFTPEDVRGTSRSGGTSHDPSITGPAKAARVTA